MSDPGLAYADTPVQILVLGDRADVFERILSNFASDRVAAYRASDLPGHADRLARNSLTGVVLAVDAVAVQHRKEQKLVAQKLTEKLHTLLPMLAQPAQVLVLARGDDPRSQAKIDRMLATVIGRAHHEATTRYGMNLSINALDISGSVDASLIADRVVELFDTREQVSTGQVLEYEEIVDQTIRCALALRFLY